MATLINSDTIEQIGKCLIDWTMLPFAFNENVTKYKDDVLPYSKMTRKEISKYLLEYITELKNKKEGYIYEKCLYTGYLIRVFNCKPSEIIYDGEIVSWSKCPDFKSDRIEVEPNIKYTFVLSEIDKEGIDINEYQKYWGKTITFTPYDEEVVAPLKIENVIEVYYGTNEEWIKYYENSR